MENGIFPKDIGSMFLHNYFYRSQRSWGKVMFLQAYVILFTGGVCLSACWDTTPLSRQLLEQAPPLEAGTPPGADPHRTGTPQSRPPGAEHAGRYGQCTGGTHPTGMQSCSMASSGNILDYK